MSFGVPLSYSELQNNLAIPSQLVGDDLKSFGKGARNNVRTVPTSSGSVGPSNTLLFNIPVGGLDYIKSNSVNLNATIKVDGSHPANATAGSFLFSGIGDGGSNVGGASSIINRINVMMGGVSQSYNNYNHMRNAVMPHILGSEYIVRDLRALEYAGVEFTTGATTGTVLMDINVSIPLWVPVFNSSQALPTLLMTSPISVEILTETIADAFAVNNTTITSYTVKDAYLTYETITVSNEFKQALLQSKSGSMYNIQLNDWQSIGPTASTAQMSYQIGLGLSSLKSICWTEYLNNCYFWNGLSNYKVFVDNLQISLNNPNNDAKVFCELNRALSKINDYNVTSLLAAEATTAINTNQRNDYVNRHFLAGASCQVFSDYGYAQTGQSASTVTLELDHTPADTADYRWKWGGQAFADHSTSAKLLVFLFHDSTLSVDVSSGVVMVRK